MTEQTTTAESTEAVDATSATSDNETVVTLDYPIQRGSKQVTEITVRKPKSGALRGVSLTDLLQQDVTVLTKVLPRITEPSLSEAELRNIDPADLFQLGGAVTGFLLPKRLREESA
ncbi:phage tail assembly protein [Salinicola sp. LHM]|uniref:phage tail assembly protein n=1 Tax=Salinicola sp. LHM TaxID=3065298 RepID=UPI002ACD1F85|nr:phage tail assembly protein [Salinicola sp. LHM]WQH33361.1 phage tail assembly protein [Salinicola sp. LHM]